MILIDMTMSGDKNHVIMLVIRPKRRRIDGVDGLGNWCKWGSGHDFEPSSLRTVMNIGA